MNKNYFTNNKLPKDIGYLFMEAINRLEQVPSSEIWKKLTHTLNSNPIKKKLNLTKQN